MKTREEMEDRVQILRDTLRIQGRFHHPAPEELKARIQELEWALEPSKPDAEGYEEIQEVFHTIIRYLFGILPAPLVDSLLGKLAQDHNYTLERLRRP